MIWNLAGSQPVVGTIAAAVLFLARYDLPMLSPHLFLTRWARMGPLKSSFSSSAVVGSIVPVVEEVVHTDSASDSEQKIPISVAPVHWTVDAAEDGSRLDRFIKRRAPGLPPGLIQRLIRQRRVYVNGSLANRNALPVAAGAEIKFPGDIKLGLSRGKKKPASTDVSLAESDLVKSWVLYRDARCVVLNKPAGLASQGGSYVGHRHVEALLPGLGSGRYWLVHRLDQEVSGAMVVARDVGAAGLLAEHFRQRRVQKTYWALVLGRPKEQSGLIELPIDGKPARTKYRVIQNLDRKSAWLELQPHTGRKHQLRIHCAYGLGTPILGDGRFGDWSETSGQSHGLHSLLATDRDALQCGLHLTARSLEFPRLTQQQSGGGARAKKNFPRSNENLVKVQATLPPHMNNTWRRLGLNIQRDELPQ